MIGKVNLETLCKTIADTAITLAKENDGNILTFISLSVTAGIVDEINSKIDEINKLFQEQQNLINTMVKALNDKIDNPKEVV